MGRLSGGLPALVLALWVAAATPAAAARGWESWLYPGYFSDLLATRSEVWCATREGGLLRWDRSTQSFDFIQREPGSIISNQLSSLALDRSGRLWVGTLDAGAARLKADRSGWDAVNTFDGLPSTKVTKLLAVGDTVWIGTDKGIALWNGHIVTGSLPDGFTVSFDSTFSDDEIRGIAQIGDSLFVASRNVVGMAHLSSNLQDWRPINTGIDPNYLPIEDMVNDGSNLFVVDAGFCYRLDRATQTWQFERGDGIMLARGATGVMLTAASGVYRWDGANFQLLPNSPTPVAKPSDTYPDYVRATDDSTGTAFAGSANVFFEQSGAASWTSHALSVPPDNGIISLAPEGPKLYITTFGGVGRWSGSDWRMWRSGSKCQLPGCLPDTSFINPIYVFGVLVQRNGLKWVGDWDVALETFTDEPPPPSFTHRWVPANGNDLASRKQTWVSATFEDAQGGVWFGLDTPVADEPAMAPLGLAQYDAAGNLVHNWNTGNSQVAGTFVHTIAQDKTGRMWLGFHGEGVEWFDPLPQVDSAGFFKLSDTNGLVVRGIAAYGESLWVLSTIGLRLYSIHAQGTDGTLVPPLGLPGGQDQFALHPLAIADDGSVWAASGAGLWHVTRNGNVQYDHTNSPLATDVVRSVAIEPGTGRVWIGSTGGLQRFDPNYQPPPPPVVEALNVRMAPNPAFLTNLGPGVSLLGDLPAYRVVIYDLVGRQVREFDVVGAGTRFWDGRDRNGTLVRPGVYFVKASAGGRSAVARLILLH
ncbi:MAG: two-component regulator propeller domain-containing protein [Candidatus Eisenbacteria bacterium]